MRPLAADHGLLYAQNSLGVFYRDGLAGLPRDDREAARLFKLAADQGLLSAQFNLVNLYRADHGSLKDDHKGPPRSTRRSGSK